MWWFRRCTKKYSFNSVRFKDNNEPQKQLSKEFVRQWLIENNFQGLDGQTMPVMPDEFVSVVTDRYIELYEKVAGEKFIKHPSSDIAQRIEQNVIRTLETLK